jgi:type 2 lantibiotic biosynthesis protein LanM
MAVREGEHASWIGLEYRNKRWSLEPTPEDLYAGLPGIALFLAFLGSLGDEAEDREATELARAAVSTLRLQVAARPDGLPATAESIGAFQGWGGIVWTLAQLGALWGDRELLAAAEAMAERFPALLPGDDDLDLIGGTAGALLGLLALHGATDSQRVLAIAVECGERLLTLAEPWGAGLGWRTRLAAERPLAGISHGVGGIALALLRLGEATSDPRFLAAALDGFAGERERFWEDLERLLRAPAGGEKPAAESTVAVAWCYGAPGVGLTRLAALPHARTAEEGAALRREVEQALRRTLARGPGQNHCLCHGDLGNLDFLLQAQERFPDPALAADLHRFLEIVLASLDRDGWLCGTRGSVDSPGLMNGFAGIGLGLLRLAEPGRVPSVLVLEGVAISSAPPRSSSTAAPAPPWS